MAIRRQKRINLDQFDPSWEGTFLLIYTVSFNAIQDFRRDVSKLQKKLEDINRDIKKLERRLEEETDEVKTDELYSQLDVANVERDKLAELMISKMSKLISDNFVGGQVFDSDAKSKREAVKEDINAFDNEVIEHLASAVTGSDPKKG